MSISSVNSSNSGALASTTGNQSQALQTLMATLQSQSPVSDILAADGSGDASSSSDVLDLSSQGQSAADELYQLLESSAQASIQTSANNASASVQEKLSTALSQSGIDTSQEIDLQVDSNGNVVVSNNNSQAQQIENTINNNPDLKKAVTQYVRFMQAIGPSMDNNSSSQTSFSAEIGQLLSSVGSGSQAQGTVTLALQGNALETSYQDANNNSVLLAASQVG